MFSSSLAFLSVNTWYVPCTAFCCIFITNKEGLSYLIGVLAMISLTALLAASITELGIESASRSSGFGSILCMFSSLDGSICLNYFSCAIF